MTSVHTTSSSMPFSEAIERAFQWQCMPNNGQSGLVFKATFFGSGNNGLLFDRAEICAYQPQLYETFWSLQRTDLLISAETIRASAKLFHHPKLTLPVDSYFTHIRNMRMPVAAIVAHQLHEKDLNGTMDVFVLQKTQAGFEYALKTKNQPFRLSRDWLDTTYPGWLDRYTVAVSLGVDNTTLLHQLFGDHPEQLSLTNSALVLPEDIPFHD